MYTRDQVYEATLKYFEGDELATTVFINKYCLKNGDNYFELTPSAMHWRLAKEFARIESKYPNPMSAQEIFHLLEKFKYIIPQGSPMAGIGNNFTIQSISNCLVIGEHIDSYGGIMKADQKQAQLMKRRCGVGQDISWLRPAGAIAGGSPLGPNAGATLYMDRFSHTTREVQQDGRRGALMLSIDIKHPDAERFIDKKMEDDAVTGANVSVKITNDFMDALEKGERFIQTFPVDADITGHPILEMDDEDISENKLYNLAFSEDKSFDGIYAQFVDPKKIWSKIIHNAWSAAEPGILFFDKILFESPARGYGLAWKEVSTNPCGEIPLPPDDSCRLLLLNLSSYVYNAYKKDSMLEDILLIDHVKKAMRLMDDIVDLEIEKIDKILENIRSKEVESDFQFVEIQLWEKIRKKAVEGRRTGLGVTGEGDLIASMGLKYGTPDATEFSMYLHQLIATAAYESSIELAEERGAFPIWDREKDLDSDFICRMFGQDNEFMTEELRQRHFQTGRRNIALLTIAPAGSVSLLSQTTSGFEPVFSIWGFRKRKITGNETKFDWQDSTGDKWVEYPTFHRPFIKWYASYTDQIFRSAEKALSIMNNEQLKELFKLSPYYGATAQDVDYIEKVRMQGAVQKWVDHSISVTVNMPENVTEELVANVYLEAYKSGCKGVTIYRNNSRGNVLSTESIKEDKDKNDFEYLSSIKRPKEIECDVYFKSAAKDPYILFAGIVQEKPIELFAVPHNDLTHISQRVTKGKIKKIKRGKYRFVSDCGNHVIENLLDHMVENEQNSTRNVSAMLRHRMDPKFIVHDVIYKYATISSLHKVMGRVLENYIKEKIINECPECSSEMIKSEGCMKCPECSHTHCG